jgi:hypothetical protein
MKLQCYIFGMCTDYGNVTGLIMARRKPKHVACNYYSAMQDLVVLDGYLNNIIL